tara:strand:- start:17199 stop:18116 length:918 start_codon:yes stop_codon:yes gene_type:complete
MPTTTNISTTYAGEKAMPYLQAALLTPNTIRNGGITVKPNIKFKQVMKKVAMSDLIKDGTCDFTPTATVDITENFLEPKEFQVNYTLCKQDFRSDWDAISMGLSAHDNLPPDLASFIIAKTAAEVATANETILWQGADGVEGEYDGFEALFAADGTVIDVVGTAADSATVQAEMRKVLNAIPQTIYGKEDLKLFVASDVYRAYVSSLALAGNGNGFEQRGSNQGFSNLQFEGIALFMCNGMSAGKMIAAQSSNLYFGTGLMNDTNEVKVLDMSELDGSQNVRFIMRYTATVGFAYGAEIVSYNVA